MHRNLVEYIDNRLLFILKGGSHSQTEYLWIQQLRELEVKENKYFKY